MQAEGRRGAGIGASHIHLERIGGDLVIRNSISPEAGWATTTQALDHWARETPDATFLAERGADQTWQRVSYEAAKHRTEDLARRLLSIGCSAERPLAIVSENSIEHALLSLAAMTVGVAIAPISMAYATIATDFSRLRYMLELVTPGAIYFGNPSSCSHAMAEVADIARLLVPGGEETRNATGIEALTPVSDDIYTIASRQVGPDTIAKLMFTSGSTGKPKAVINTQRMLCANQAMLKAVWPTLSIAKPVLVDWLPWTHTFGANFTFNLSLFNGGALYIDAGKPVPQAIGVTIRNLAEIQPTIYFNVPAGFEALLAQLRKDRETAERVFSRMEFAFFAAAALPQSVRNGLQELALEVTGRHLSFHTGWGSTETAPCATATWWDTERSDNIGLPLPGVELRFAPDGDKLELRVRGPNVTPGYWKSEEGATDAFDEQGFYRMGDAGLLIDHVDPTAGVLFDGRVAENFKLTSGTWVSVGAIRIGVLNEGRPFIRDAVVTGSGRADVGLLVFVNHAACKDLIGTSANEMTDDQIAAHPAVRKAVASAIAHYNGSGRGSSSRIDRFLILPDHPRMEHYEITDKGYINQRATLHARALDVEALYADPANQL